MADEATDGYTNEQRRELVKKFLDAKRVSPKDDQEKRAIAFAIRMLERLPDDLKVTETYADCVYAENLNRIEAYCYLVNKGEIMLPGPFYDFWNAMDCFDQTDFADMARGILEGA